MEIISNNMFFGIFISLIAFEIGLFIYKKTKLPIFNPLLTATILIICFLKIFNIDFDTIMKMKSVMDAMNSKKNDPRAKLLMSLKPYLKDSRKQKLDQYVQLLNMSSVFELFKENGGDFNSNSK